ncbi:MAG TPA: hypothetical protein VF077_00445 [Nitrospiraceae bacterium]
MDTTKLLQMLLCHLSTQDLTLLAGRAETMYRAMTEATPIETKELSVKLMTVLLQIKDKRFDFGNGAAAPVHKSTLGAPVTNPERKTVRPVTKKGRR